MSDSLFDFDIESDMRYSVNSIKGIANLQRDIACSNNNNISVYLGAKYISPALYPFILSVIDVAHRHEKRIKISYSRNNKRLENSLNQHGVLQFYSGSSWKTDSNTLPFQEVLPGDSTTNLVSKIRKLIPVNMSNSYASNFMSKIYEVLINSQDHSRSLSSAKANAYTDKRKFYFSVYDAGVGIPFNVKNFLSNPLLDDIDAVKWALTEGNTTAKNASSIPRGAGLGVLEKFVKENNGKMFIATGSCLCIVKKGNTDFERFSAPIMGTFFSMQANVDRSHIYCDSMEEIE